MDETIKPEPFDVDKLDLNSFQNEMRQHKRDIFGMDTKPEPSDSTAANPTGSHSDIFGTNIKSEPSNIVVDSLANCDNQRVNCSICGKSFRNPQTRERHMMITHSNNQHVNCTNCGKSFHNPHYLKRHRMIIHGTANGRICEKSFRNTVHLKRHVTAVHGNFCIVSFNDNVGIVLRSWLVNENRARWPGVNSKAHRNLLLSDSPPNYKWNIYKVTVHKFTDDYAEACRLESRLEDNTELSSSDVMETSNKRKIIPVTCPDFDHTGITPQYNVDHAGFTPRYNVDMDVTSVRRSFNKLEPIASCSYHSTGDDARNQKRYIKNTSTPELPPAIAAEFEKLNEKITEVYRFCREGFDGVQYQLSCLLMEKHGTGSGFQFPIRTLADLGKLNSHLENAENGTAMMETFRKIDGRNAANHLHGILRTIFADELAVRINWKGTAGRQAFEQTPLCWTIINTILNHRPGEISTQTVKKCIQAWFHNAPNRKFTKNIGKRIHAT